MGDTIQILLCGLVVSAAIIFLEIFLSRLKYRLPGLILPCAFLVASLFAIYKMIMLPEGTDLAALGSVFMLINTPTFIFVAIYWSFSGTRKKKRNKNIK